MVKMYIGKITKVLPDYTINFNIPGYAELAGEGVASPAVKLTRMPVVNDEIMLIQPNDQIEIFTYLLMTQDSLGISLQNGTGYVRITSGSTSAGVIEISNGVSYIKLDSNGNVIINGHLEISQPPKSS